MKNPVREYKRMKRIVGYYKDSMQDMIRCRKYAQLGLLLLSNVSKGDVVYLTGHQGGIFDQIHVGIVEMVEFIGDNDARIVVRDTLDPSGVCSGKRYVVRNCEYGKFFFTDRETAMRSLAEEGVSSVKKG